MYRAQMDSRLHEYVLSERLQMGWIVRGRILPDAYAFCMAYKSVLAGDKSLIAVGKAVRETRLERGLSQEDLAVDANVERSYMGAIERAEANLTLIVLTRICRALKIKPSELLAKARL